MHANDRDEGKNAEIRYSLESANNELFSIDPSSGWVTNLVELDRETKPSYTLKVIANDNGNPVFSATATVQISLVDVNDNPSIFTHPAYVASGKYPRGTK